MPGQGHSRKSSQVKGKGKVKGKVKDKVKVKGKVKGCGCALTDMDVQLNFC